MMPDKPRIGDWLQTASGRAFWPADPRPEEIFIEDIAAALSRQCRYAGHLRYDIEHYSVAEHSVYVSRLCPPEFAMWGLLHDASEAYLVDVPRPVKPCLIGYKELEQRLEECIAIRFGLCGATIPTDVKTVDNRIIFNEQRDVMVNPAPRLWSNIQDPFPCLTIACWSPSRARREFLSRFYEFTGDK